MKKILISATVISVVAVAVATAHTGATGVVRERMDGMMAMRDAVRALTPMMQGQAEYDSQAVVAAAAIIESHAGETMTTLFEEGTGGPPSAATPAVWEDWEAFAAIAMRLETVAEALGQAAVNAPGSAMPEGSMQADAGAMMGGASSMMGDSVEPDAEMMAQMPVDRVFALAAQTCSSCHTSYRVEQED
ncbi:c-type cytochrome [Gymnodinialimonas ceratoperidinii]|uniref:Cytochrome c n=1 Tax=Gymnodinialimonas ceratoperidinii TaxID=2856823 RepID=A0A8F6TZR5_9RHOB|nr:cytochrome c [Gymnodinialimonas ceratoperidinii]QXT40994.1 cytochrome c [Gymnodinialimonas ceratoperidinii]